MKLPESGEKIPVDNFHVSPLNVRADEPFGHSKEDEVLIVQLSIGKIVAPFKARPEGEGYGVFVGRRRFLGKKEAGTKHFVVGRDVIIENVSDDEARRESLIENLEILRKEMNPIARAKALNQIVIQAGGIRSSATQLGLSIATMSEWLKILELSKRMQQSLEKGLLNYTEALMLARSELSHAEQDALMATLENEGYDAFRKEAERISHRELKRGLPKGKYFILRTTFDRNFPADMEVFEKLREMAEEKNMRIDEYCKWVITEYIGKIEQHAKSKH